MTRPRGEFRSVIGEAFAEFGHGGATWRDVAQQAGVSWGVAKATVRNMASGGELVVVGTVSVPGIRRPMLSYVPVAPAAPPGADLERAIRGWADFK